MQNNVADILAGCLHHLFLQKYIYTVHMRAGTHTQALPFAWVHIWLKEPRQIKTVKLTAPTPEIRLTQTTSEQGEGFCQVTQS